MDELVEFLLARIAEDEDEADDKHDLDCDCVQPVPYLCDCGYPARVLAECEAKRQIVEWCGERERIYVGGLTFDPERPRPDHFVPGPLRRPTDAVVLRFLALPYASHPDYRDEWRP